MEDTSNEAYVAKIKTAFAGLNYPVTKEQILLRKGDARVDVAAGKNVSVREALKPITAVTFESQESLLNEINAAHHLGWPEQ